MFEASLDTTVLTASFIEQTRIPTDVFPADGGTVKITPVVADGFYTVRSEVTITATPAPGFFFVGWFGFTFRGIHGDASNPAVFTTNSAGTDYTAFFVTQSPLIIHTNIPATRVEVNGMLSSLPPGSRSLQTHLSRSDRRPLSRPCLVEVHDSCSRVGVTEGRQHMTSLFLRKAR